MKTLLIYFAMGIARVIAWMPLSVAHALGAGFGWLSWRRNNRRTKISRTNIQLCYPHLSASESEALVKQSMIESGKTLFEAGMTWFWPLEKVDRLITRVTGMEHLQKALDEKQGNYPDSATSMVHGRFSTTFFAITCTCMPCTNRPKSRRLTGGSTVHAVGSRLA